MKILIAGAGVGGLALARGLKDKDVRVLEEAPAPRTGGAAVTIFSNGAAALAGIGAPLGSLGGRIDRLRFLTGTGKPVFTADLTVMARKTGFGTRTVPRDRLIAHLASGLAPDTVAYGRGVTGVDDGAIVDATGAHHYADVLVGADGHRSAVRRAVLDPAPARDCGWTTWQGLTPILPEIAGSTDGICVVGEAGLCGLMPAGNGLVQWWFDVPEPITGSPVAALRTRFGGYAGPVGAALDAIDDAAIAPFQHVVHDVPDRWGTGATTLLGDAAHVFPPTQAQGANQALEDAWLLSRTLSGGPPDVAAALRRYEAIRAKRVRRLSRLAASERTNKPTGAATALFARLIPPKLLGTFYTGVVRGWSSVLNGEKV